MRKLIALVFAVGCGGGGAKYHVDDASLASLSMQEKQGIFAAQNEKNQAQAEMQQFQANYKNADHDVDVADNDYKSAKLQLDSAKLNLKSAEQASDVNRKQSAQREVQVAELGVKAADAKVDWLKKKRKWYDLSADAAEKHVAACDSRAELEKAKLAQQKGIRPDEKFDPMLFEQDYQEKSRKYNDAKLDADRLKPEVDGKEREYTTQQQAFDQSRGAAQGMNNGTGTGSAPRY
jgi:hypothetical protein